VTWYTGRIADIERSPDGPWARLRLDNGTRLYIHEESLRRIEQQFGVDLAATKLRFRANRLLRRVQNIELVEPAAYSVLSIPFSPDASRPTWTSSALFASVLLEIVRSIPEAPAKNGLQVSLQRVRRHALGVLNATPQHPYFPDFKDEEEMFLFVNAYLRANPSIADQLNEEVPSPLGADVSSGPRHESGLL
jgi:hypothetical protein